MTLLPRRWLRQSTGRAAAVTGWCALAVADLAATVGVLPGLSTRLHTLAVGGAVALTVLAVWGRQAAAVRAAFLDGVLYAQQHDQPEPQLRRAAGDGVVVPFNRRQG